MSDIAFIFDLDGTLIDSYGVIVSCLKQVYEEKGITLNEEEILKEVLDTSVHFFIEDMENRYGIPFDELKERYSSISNIKLASIGPIKHAKEMLDYLKSKNIPLYIFTHRGVSTKATLLTTKINNYFDEVVTSLYGYPRKPYPDGLIYLIDKYHLDKSKTYYVGDRSIDIECASKAGIKSILYLPHPEIVKPTNKETYIIKDLLDIKNIVK